MPKTIRVKKQNLLTATVKHSALIKCTDLARSSTQHLQECCSAVGSPTESCLWESQLCLIVTFYGLRLDKMTTLLINGNV